MGTRPAFEFSGHRFPVLAGQGASQQVAAGPGVMLVRPEHVEVLPLDASSGVPGVVQRSQAIGDAVVYDVAVDGGPVLRAKTGRQREHALLDAGARVKVGISETAPGWLLPQRADVS
jgi:hypothetical protein